jgi:ribosomal protein L11 methyltransferase
MMIEQMQDIDFRNKTVFDFGTGTGILSILAEKLGASKIEAVDVDDWSITNAKENIAENGCFKISLKRSSQIISNKTFDIVLANINRNVILNSLPQLGNNLKPNCLLLLSGLLSSDEPDIVEACNEEKLNLVKRIERNNWISLLFIKSI